MGLDDTRARPEREARPPSEEQVVPVDVAGSPTRCPYCHDQVTVEQFAEALVCERCLSRHHADCWDGRCGSCGSERALGQRSSTGARYERFKAAVSWGYLACFVACFPAIIPAAFLGRPDGLDGPPPPALWPFLTMIFVTSALSVLMWAVNSYDAAVRRAREGGRSPGLLLALTSPLTGGLTGFVYFVLWGREPLPPPPPPRK